LVTPKIVSRCYDLLLDDDEAFMLHRSTAGIVLDHVSALDTEELMSKLLLLSDDIMHSPFIPLFRKCAMQGQQLGAKARKLRTLAAAGNLDALEVLLYAKSISAEDTALLEAFLLKGTVTERLECIRLGLLHKCIDAIGGVDLLRRLAFEDPDIRVRRAAQDALPK
jgi:hypothetical protein